MFNPPIKKNVFESGVAYIYIALKSFRQVKNYIMLLAIPFSKHHFFQTDNQIAILFTAFSLFELFFSNGGERKPT